MRRSGAAGAVEVQALPWQGAVTPTWLTWGQLAAGLVFHLRRGLGWVLFTLATPFDEVEQVLLRLAYDLEPLESSGPTPVFSLLSAVGAALAWPGGLLSRLAWRTLPDGAFIEPYVPESLGEWSRYTSSRIEDESPVAVVQRDQASIAPRATVLLSEPPDR